MISVSTVTSAQLQTLLSAEKNTICIVLSDLKKNNVFVGKEKYINIQNFLPGFDL